jgi:hypothetical protein
VKMARVSGWNNQTPTPTSTTRVVLLPGFQKGRDIKASKGKGQRAVLTKKSAICFVLEGIPFLRINPSVNLGVIPPQ